jgi:two-component system, response regulator RegA
MKTAHVTRADPEPHLPAKLAADGGLATPDQTSQLLLALRRAVRGRELDTLPSLDRIEWAYITGVLEHTNGNISAAARILGLQRSTLQRRLKKNPAAR